MDEDDENGPSEEEERAREYAARRDYLEVSDPDEDYELNDSVRVRVNSTTKKMWEDYADRREGIGNLSALVRLAVAKEMRGGFESGEQTQDQILEAVLEVKDAVDETHSEVRKTHEDIIDESKLESALENAIDGSLEGDE
ncbi:MAG: hypothetical protein ABEJ40_06265 [Haloarculaceae archaeon]